jgi:DNA-binding transcriptional LysR family regulator
MLIEAEAAEHVVKGRLAEPSGVARVTSSVPTAQLMLADVVVEAARMYPKLRIVVHATDRFVDIVQEGFDIAVRDHFNPLPDSGLVQRRIATDPVYLIASPAYLQQRGEPREPGELAEHDALSTAPGSAVWKLENEAGERVEVQAPARFTADESTVLLRAAAAGLGIASLPRKLCQPSLDAGELVRVLPGWIAGGVTTTVLMPHRRGQLPSVRAVVELLAGRQDMTEPSRHDV